MKKNYKMINGSRITITQVFFITLVLALSACQKYVDIQSSSSQNYIETAQDCQLVLNDYSTMNTGYPSDGEASSDDYYILTNNYGSVSNVEDRAIYTWDPGAIRASASPQWQSGYKKVNQSNLVLENVERLKGKEDQGTLNSIRGQALFFRAYAFWNIAQLYCKPYGSTSGTDPGIPIRLSSDINGKSSRGTVQQTYDQIVSDLKEALTLLSPTSVVASQPNKAAVNAMLARVYLSMEDYPNALTSADAAIQLTRAATASLLTDGPLFDYNNLTSTQRSSSTPFNPRFNPEVIFHSLIASSPLLNPGSATGSIARIPDDLYASYNSNDLRKTVFFKGNTITLTYPDPLDPTKTKTAQVADGTYRFTGNYEPQANAIQFNGLAVDEMYLTRAECYARTGNKDAAMADLNALLVKRWVTGTYTDMTASSTDDALTKVLAERRKELLMRSQRWTDLRRLNKDPLRKKDLTRDLRTLTVQGTSPTDYTLTYTVNSTYSLPANDLRYVLLIPQEVTTNTGLAQNLR